MHNRKHTCTGRIITWLRYIWWFDFIKCNIITHCISLINDSDFIVYPHSSWQSHSSLLEHTHTTEIIKLKCIVAKITSCVQSCLLKCFIVYPLSYCLKIPEKKLLGYSYFYSHIEWVMPPFSSSVYHTEENFGT